MKKKVMYLIILSVFLISSILNSCHNPWMEDILGDLVKGSVISVSVSPPRVTTPIGTAIINQQLTATVAVKKGAPQTVEWSVYNEGTTGSDKVTVSPGGMLNVAAAATEGTATIRATSTHDSRKYGTCIVTIGASPQPQLIEMVSIPAGTFMMGSPVSEPNRNSIETQHSVELTKGFSMGKYPVTQAQYQAVMGSNPSSFNGSDLPVEQVSWYDALVFCNKLSMSEGLTPAYSINGSTNPAAWGSVPTGDDATWNGATMDLSANGYRLPTEAEWEYACRGDYPNKATATNTKPFGIGDDGTKMELGMANFYIQYSYDLARSGEYNVGNNTGYVGQTTPVGNYGANNYGLCDMHGNVFEWCWDRYKADITGDNTDPTGAVSGSYRVLRGGSWSLNGQILRSAYRRIGNPWGMDNLVGFRVVRPAP